MRYYIVDPCYVFTDDPKWQEYVKTGEDLWDERLFKGTYNGVSFESFRVDDGTYELKARHGVHIEFASVDVDAGLLACLSEDKIIKAGGNLDEAKELGFSFEATKNVELDAPHLIASEDTCTFFAGEWRVVFEAPSW